MVGEAPLGGIKTVLYVLLKSMAQMGKQINIGKVNHFNIEKTEMLSANHKFTAFTTWGPNLLHCSHQIVRIGLALTSKHGWKIKTGITLTLLVQIAIN